jgi:predicted regulator of Ras-like GTPase activity (Roadblock/LC7/MglB family)
MEALAPLTRLMGVHFVALVTADGVPIPVPCENGPNAYDADRLAAVAQQFVSEIVEATAPLTWGPPRFARIQSERGGAALLRVRGGSILVLHGTDADAASLRLPMEAAAERIERQLERFGSNRPDVDRAPAALPSTTNTAEHDDPSAAANEAARAANERASH